MIPAWIQNGICRRSFWTFWHVAEASSRAYSGNPPHRYQHHHRSSELWLVLSSHVHLHHLWRFLPTWISSTGVLCGLDLLALAIRLSMIAAWTADKAICLNLHALSKADSGASDSLGPTMSPSSHSGCFSNYTWRFWWEGAPEQDSPLWCTKICHTCMRHIHVKADYFWNHQGP